jgi:fructose-1-phosphate kinase PfkB-like protein
MTTIAEDIGPSDLLVIAGSLPDSVDPSVVGRIVVMGRSAGARTLLDIHGSSLSAGIEAGPWMVKVNRDELLGLADAKRPAAAGQAAHRVTPIPELVARMVALRARGTEVVVVTLGADGVLLADASGVIHATVPPIEVVNPTGSGDLVLAGLAVAIARGQSPRDALVLGAACGTAGATHLLPELPPGFDAAAWTTRVSVRAVPAAP